MTAALGRAALQVESAPAELVWGTAVFLLALLLVVAVLLVVRSSRRGWSDLRELAERAARAEAHAEQLRERLAEARDDLQRVRGHTEGRGEPMPPGQDPYWSPDEPDRPASDSPS